MSLSTSPANPRARSEQLIEPVEITGNPAPDIEPLIELAEMTV